MSKSSSSSPYHAVIVGGGPAGLQAALTLGRMHRRTALFDSGEYRNATAGHAHNLITNDGRPPAELRAIARDELGAYDAVDLHDVGVSSIRPVEDGFAVVTAASETLHARTIVLATGMRDVLPAIPGLAQEWGRGVAQCPFCHGHEFRGLPVAVLGAGQHADMIRGMLAPVVSTVTVIDPARVTSVDRRGDLMALSLADGAEVQASGIFVAATGAQRSPLAAQLGCRMLESGCVEIDAFGLTSVPGVFAAGDMAHVAALPNAMVSLAAAIASGQMAGASSVRHSLS